MLSPGKVNSIMLSLQFTFPIKYSFFSFVLVAFSKEIIIKVLESDQCRQGAQATSLVRKCCETLCEQSRSTAFVVGFVSLPPKRWNPFLQLGKGHLAELDFWKLCFIFKYSLVKKVFVALFSSRVKGKKNIILSINLNKSQECDKLS